ncbi:hypothetical protein [Hydrocarboniclastica marina]|uniref:Uncharacterized protein n=1 Tax=Hydrocarboniclastica marina TaxID=2259620 RepID=A0A4P7XID8_9ALTE|nr:hypothetical protein [Hydrocarboniclastica marina]QCF26284.1 hypothetical protein soil367_10250 [Hydrocarboniclastica marina]
MPSIQKHQNPFSHKTRWQLNSSRLAGFPAYVVKLAFTASIISATVPGCATFASPQNLPEISGVERVGGPHEEFLIRGSKFSAADHEWIVKDSGAEIYLYENGEIGSVSPDKLWEKGGSPWAKPLERVQDEVGRQADYQAKGKSFNSFLKPLDDKGSTQLFVSWQLKLSESPGHSKGSNKFIRVWDDTSGKGTRVSWTQMHLTYSGSKKPSWGGWPGKKDEWNQMSLWVDGNKGAIQARVNDTLSHDIHDFIKADTPEGLNVALLGFDPNRSTPYKDMKVEIDELYVSSTPARVVISDESTWAQAQNRQSIQIPILWRESGIRFVYQPAEYLEDKRFLYVVNKHGEANRNGFPFDGEVNSGAEPESKKRTPG